MLAVEFSSEMISLPRLSARKGRGQGTEIRNNPTRAKSGHVWATPAHLAERNGRLIEAVLPAPSLSDPTNEDLSVGIRAREGWGTRRLAVDRGWTTPPSGNRAMLSLVFEVGEELHNLAPASMLI